MTGHEADSSEGIDVRKVHHLVRLMKRYDVTDLDLSDGSLKIRLRRRGPELAAAASPMPHSAVGSAPLPLAPATPPATPAPGTQEPPPAEPPAPKTVVIESPMVGTFYSSNSPDTPPFVKVGSVVQPDTPLCIIEAMKVFTDIPAGVSGTISEILVKNGQPVEFGQPLFRVIPS
jgi:acetyl-CoA carboxylase biotin carboxyl carrier protein